MQPEHREHPVGDQLRGRRRTASSLAGGSQRSSVGDALGTYSTCGGSHASSSSRSPSVQQAATTSNGSTTPGAGGRELARPVQRRRQRLRHAHKTCRRCSELLAHVLQRETEQQRVECQEMAKGSHVRSSDCSPGMNISGARASATGPSVVSASRVIRARASAECGNDGVPGLRSSIGRLLGRPASTAKYSARLPGKFE
ncbi:MAG TPA: hypothetical protein VK923_05825 [Euzebyales bacterium]|nr:hypothetical protein [Euzebyales bacterium]